MEILSSVFIPLQTLQTKIIKNHLTVDCREVQAERCKRK